MNKKLVEMDFNEIEKRFIARAGSMEVTQPQTPKNYGGSMNNYLVQSAAAEVLMQRYHAYALSIGCTLSGSLTDGDVEANEVQAALLDIWWKENAK